MFCNEKIKFNSFEEDKKIMYKAFKLVRKQKGKAGIDGVNIFEYEGRYYCDVIQKNLTNPSTLEKNLYKLWIRMKSGTYFPKAVRYCEIPKSNGKKRILGIPTVEDRVAQMVVKLQLEQYIDSTFDDYSFGFRPNKSAHQALTFCYIMSKKNSYIIDVDFQTFFDTVDHAILMNIVREYVKEWWCILYIERWLKVPFNKKEKGKIFKIERKAGTPQGGVISPLLANLFLNTVYDTWLRVKNANFVRYADDSVIFCETRTEAEELLRQLEEQMNINKLKINKDKTKIVNLNENINIGENRSFDFLGFSFEKINNILQVQMSKKNFDRLLLEVDLMDIKNQDENLHEVINLIKYKLFGWINYFSIFNKARIDIVINKAFDDLVNWNSRFKTDDILIYNYNLKIIKQFLEYCKKMIWGINYDSHISNTA